MGKVTNIDDYKEQKFREMVGESQYQSLQLIKYYRDQNKRQKKIILGLSAIAYLFFAATVALLSL